MGTTRTVLAAALAAVLATPAAADDFCSVLKAVVAAAPKGFAGVRGTRDPEYTASYWRPVALPGARALGPAGWPCFALHGSKLTPPDQYHCDFPGGPDRPTQLEAMHDLADKVSGCLSPMVSDDAAGVWRLSVGGVRVVVSGADAPPGLREGVVEIIVEPPR